MEIIFIPTMTIIGVIENMGLLIYNIVTSNVNFLHNFCSFFNLIGFISILAIYNKAQPEQHSVSVTLNIITLVNVTFCNIFAITKNMTLKYGEYDRLSLTKRYVKWPKVLILVN